MTEHDAADTGPGVSLPIDGKAGTGEGSDGVDVSLIRWFLGLTPAQRLRVLQNTVNAVSRLREQGAPQPRDGPCSPPADLVRQFAARMCRRHPLFRKKPGRQV